MANVQCTQTFILTNLNVHSQQYYTLVHTVTHVYVHSFSLTLMFMYNVHNLQIDNRIYSSIHYISRT